MTPNPIFLSKIQSYVLNKKIIISLDEQWTQYFESSNPSFDVTINDNKVVLVGPKVKRKDPQEQNSHDG